MIGAVEVQIISKLLTTQKEQEIDALIAFDESYYSGYAQEIKYIRDHYNKFNEIPSVFDFKMEFPEFVIVTVTESLEYLQTRIRENKKRIMFVNTFNKVKDLNEGDINEAWKYLSMQCDLALQLGEEHPLNLIQQAEERAKTVKDYSKQKRIPTGFDEIDKAMYGGLSTVEELLVLIARMGSGKSWICVKMMESAHKHGFRVAYYSPEMQGAFLATRFDTWRNHFENSKLYRGDYSSDYEAYIQSLKDDPTPAYIIEDKDFPDGVSVSTLSTFVKKNGIQLLIVDGISYMKDDQNAGTTQDKYKNIAQGLFQLSKRYGCACVLVMQCNREVRNKDDKGEAIPDLFNAEGSDHPGRIATQAFGVRQVFEKHVLDIELLKSRTANNQRPVFSYLWDINTGSISYISDPDSSGMPPVPDTAQAFAANIIPTSVEPDSNDMSLLEDDFDDSDVEF